MGHYTPPVRVAGQGGSGPSKGTATMVVGEFTQEVDLLVIGGGPSVNFNRRRPRK